MNHEEPPTWTLTEHLRHGRAAIIAITASQLPIPEPVCHHFSPAEDIDINRLLLEDGYAEVAYGHLEVIFGAQGLEFLLDRREAWETCLPTLEWLQIRVPAMTKLAAEHSLIYEGWTWEPRDSQPIGACTFGVISNRPASA